jgi:hypothetical protein
MENAKEMNERHAKEMKTLQEKCEHKNISDWIRYEYAPGHGCGEVKVCKFCDKITETSWDNLY